VSEQYKRNPNTACIICKKAIYKRPSVIDANKGRVFCSSYCYSVSCRKEKPCVICGKMLLAGFHKKTCSRGCANTLRSGIKYNIGRPRDKVVSQQALKVRLSLERGKNCEKCGYDKYEILQVHHKDRNRNNNELENLELLCPNCHYEDHFLFGKKMIKS
jgi:hypothetical protein